MAVHEFGFLVLTSSFFCWHSPSEPCAVKNVTIPLYEATRLKDKPKEFLKGTNFKDFRSAEVGYEIEGLAIVEEIKPDWFQVEKKSGQKLWIHLPTANKQFQSASAIERTSLESRFEPEGMLNVAENFHNHLRREDLATPLPVSANVTQKIVDRRVRDYLAYFKIQLPTAYLEVETPCTMVQISENTKKGSCQPAPKTAVYLTPDKTSASTSITLNSGNWVGYRGFQGDTKIIEHLYFFESKGEWLQIQVPFGPQHQRKRWINRNDFQPLEITPIKSGPIKKTALDFLRSIGREKEVAEIDRPYEPSFSATGRTKWSKQGVLWIEVELGDIGPCDETSGTAPRQRLMKGWLPYKLKMNADPLVSWTPRGC